ncbi:hypothetical protein C8F04DRAFT_1256269 [Mycena alexandri]|uniref:NUC153 domain-containing protein n=1 Tax=Mycena alexandri TaxID=1745969 RepID=A0AAD6T212_9AGAR|nr:hypothetical protein C8F04DRAFT_1256269 [Mycena alexandri]
MALPNLRSTTRAAKPYSSPPTKRKRLTTDSTAGHDSTRPINLADTNPNGDIDLDEDNFADLDAQAAEYSKSHADGDSSEGSQTNRLAAVNLDWDHVRAAHLFKICASLVSPSAAPASVKSTSDHAQKGLPSHPVRGKVLSVRIYPSEFGKERLAREEKEGPPPEIFKKSSPLEEDEIDEKNIYEVGDENDYDEDALRRYQLERLRYYYAIVTCDSTEAAAHIYSELEGTELERSANIFDLSFVPNDMTFDQECSLILIRDEATEDSSTSNKGVDFVTDALRHSKVKLTWDEDDPERNQVTRRTLTRKEIEEADFKAYLASSSEDESDDENRNAKSKGASRDKLRSLLLTGGGDELPEGWDREQDEGDGDVDMEITFTPGLTETKELGETTLDKYQRKMREKRKKKKTEIKPADGGDEEDEFFDDGKVPAPTRAARGSAPAIKPSRSLSTAEELSLLVSSDKPTTEPRHFDMKAILKAEKQAKRKGKKRKTVAEDEMQEDFAINVNDSRFNVLHEDHAFAIDPSNPQFKKTKGMNALLEERSKRQKHKRESVEVGGRQPDEGGRSLQNLVESVKRKSTLRVESTGKRRRIQD